MTEAYEAELRAMSRAAFGQNYRLEVMLAVADAADGLVNLTELARTLDLPTSNVQVPLKSLLTLALISEAPSGDSKRKYYLRNPSHAWAWAREMRAAAQAAVETAPVARTGTAGRAELSRSGSGGEADA
ncbi:hypothetical protein AB6N24_15015 [Cellulomonas sp. 179-A 4D5 NHS]|uniref:hypothetical protein n=1 Tax=Cellulomonas sp. 179-A 4D5 NHS TaxID=3142378 RepID=UPI0039A1576A